MLTSPDFWLEDIVSISVLLRLLVLMFRSPPSPESFVPTENVLIPNFSTSSTSSCSGGLINSIPSAETDMFPPFPELPSSEAEKELSPPVVMLPSAETDIFPPFPELPSCE